MVYLLWAASVAYILSGVALIALGTLGIVALLGDGELSAWLWL